MPADLRVDIVTLFPELFFGPLATGLLGKAHRAGRLEVGYVDPRSFTQDRHRTVDDAPYGGGAGMVMKVEPLAPAIRTVRDRGDGPVVLVSPQGRPLAQEDFARWAEGGHLGIVCGRYEGYDERVRGLVDDEVSLGDFVLTGGEYAALVMVDGVTRLLPGTLGNTVSAVSDSFSDGLLEHPQYTRPEVFEGQSVPEVLLGGDHAKIASWRHEAQLLRTRARRPDLFVDRALEPSERRALARTGPPPRRIWVMAALPEDDRALLQLLELRLAYDLEAVVVVGEGAEARIAALPALEQAALPPAKRRERRGRIWTLASEVLVAHASWSEALAAIPEGMLRLGVEAEPRSPIRSPIQARAAAKADGLALVVDAPERLEAALTPIRQGTEANRLDGPLRAALALDRVIGEA